MRMRFCVPAVPMSALLLSACANFWTIPGEPLTTAELCARAESVPVRSAPAGVGYRSTFSKTQATASALYLQAAADPLSAPALYVQANSLLRSTRTYNRSFEESHRISSGHDYWSDRCREAQEREAKHGR